MKYLAILFFMLPPCIYCQDTIQTTTIIFDQENVDEIINKGKASVNYKNAIKINPLLLFNGELPIYYERALTNSLSLELAIGLTFSDYLNNTFTEAFSDSDSERLTVGGEVKADKNTSNISFKSAFRYYFDGVSLDGSFYVSLGYFHRTHSRELDIIVNKADEFGSLLSSENNKFEEFQKHNELNLIFGNQEVNWGGSHFFFDYYGGIGIDFYSYEEVRIRESNFYPTYTLESKTKTRPKIYLGFKMGFLF